MFEKIISHEVIASVIVGFLVCQLIKIITRSAEEKKLALHVFFETGGMPSTHAAFVSSLALSIGFVEGFFSSVFLVALGLALIVIRDAMGVRRTVDNVIHSLNTIIQEKKLKIEHIKVIAGHTPVQVISGIIISCAAVLVMHFFVF